MQRSTQSRSSNLPVLPTTQFLKVSMHPATQSGSLAQPPVLMHFVRLLASDVWHSWYAGDGSELQFITNSTPATWSWLTQPRPEERWAT